jgi:hypothetical protein
MVYGSWFVVSGFFIPPGFAPAKRGATPGERSSFLNNDWIGLAKFLRLWQISPREIESQKGGRRWKREK